MTDFESMTAAELEAYKVAQKARINEIREDMAQAESVRRVKHMQELAVQALKDAGVTGVTISPEPAVLTAEMGTIGGNE